MHRGTWEWKQGLSIFGYHENREVFDINSRAGFTFPESNPLLVKCSMFLICIYISKLRNILSI